MEEWKDIPGYEGLYQASTEGRIRTCEGKVTSNARFEHRVWKQRILKFKHATRKYSRFKETRVSLWKDGTEHSYIVARLIALTWCDGYRDGMTVNHIDGNPENNCYTNLEWVTLADNIRHGFNSGLYPTKKTTLIAPDGKELHFISMAAASRFLGRPNQFVSASVKKGALITPEGYRIEVAS